jgi:hypothetical protein
MIDSERVRRTIRLGAPASTSPVLNLAAKGCGGGCAASHCSIMERKRAKLEVVCVAEEDIAAGCVVSALY